MKIWRAVAFGVFLRLTLAVSSAQAPLTELTATDGMRTDSFGWSVAAKGNILVVGAISASNELTHKRSGAAYVFVNPGNGWAQTAKLTPSDGGFDAFGTA